MKVARRVGFVVVATVLTAVSLPTAGAAAPGWQEPTRPGWKDPRAQRGWVESKLRHMTLEEKVGQMFMTFAFGRGAEETDPTMVAANRALHGVDNVVQLVSRYHLGGVIYFSRSPLGPSWPAPDNVVAPAQIAALSNGIQRIAMSQRLPVPVLIATDQEQGLVARVGEPATQLPGNMALGAARDSKLAFDAAAITAIELRAMGINQNLAPVADVNVNPANPVIGVRSYSSDPKLVARLTHAQVTATQHHDVIATAKHFPGHGDTDVDSHTGLPVINHTLEELAAVDLPPFRAAIEAGVDTVMTAHIVVPALDGSGRPATLSAPILNGVLRGQLGFEGVIVADALTMAGVRQMFGDERVPIEAIKAGVDVLLMPPSLEVAYRAVVDAIGRGELSEARIDESVRRILALKLSRGLFRNPFVDETAVSEVVGNPVHSATADAVAQPTITLVKNDVGLLPLAAGAGEPVVVTGFGGTTLTSLSGFLDDHGLRSEILDTGINPGPDARDAAVTLARQSDLVVAVTSRAWANPGQQHLVNDLLATGRPVVVVAARDPYDIAHFDHAPTYVATYSLRPVSMKALARTLFGVVAPRGKLPVTIPPVGDPAGVLYPFGHGLSYP